MKPIVSTGAVPGVGVLLPGSAPGGPLLSQILHLFQNDSGLDVKRIHLSAFSGFIPVREITRKQCVETSVREIISKSGNFVFVCFVATVNRDCQGKWELFTPVCLANCLGGELPLLSCASPPPPSPWFRLPKLWYFWVASNLEVLVAPVPHCKKLDFVSFSDLVGFLVSLCRLPPPSIAKSWTVSVFSDLPSFLTL